MLSNTAHKKRLIRYIYIYIYSMGDSSGEWSWKELLVLVTLTNQAADQRCSYSLGNKLINPGLHAVPGLMLTGI